MPIPVTVRIEGVDLPGATCGPSPVNPGGHHGILVGVQRRAKPTEWLGLTPGDAPSVTWELPCSVEGDDITGPWVQGPRGGRFVYLSWLHGEDRTMFRRAKLPLGPASVDPSVLAVAKERGVLVCRIGLTDERGNPRCASVGPQAMAWSAG
jgi:hypothetical protein